MEENNQLALFEKKQIRQTEFEGETYFSVVDIIGVLTDSPDPRNYWKVLKNREPQLVTICNQLKLLAADGKQRLSDCANTEGVLRIIQSVPSPKAEPFKQWLAQTGREKIEELNDPELSLDRLKENYLAKGYTEEWIEQRLKSIVLRKQLTDEWKKRGVTEGSEYSILTAEIAKETFGIAPKDHATLKGLDKQNLRDHMTDLELVFTMLGEVVTRNTAVSDDAQGFHENLDAAKKGGRVAGNARRNAEKVMNVKVVTAKNFLKTGADQPQELPENLEEKSDLTN